jgi:ABC-type Fe3+ transport system permease subunit
VRGRSDTVGWQVIVSGALLADAPLGSEDRAALGPEVVLSGICLVAVLLGVAGFYAWRQVLLLRRLRDREYLPSEEDSFLRRQAWRRLINSGLMVVLAGLLTFSLIYLEGRVGKVAEERKDLTAENAPKLTPEQEQLVRVWGWMQIAILLLLLTILSLAAVDLFSTRRYARRAYRQLQADRRAMIERQVARLREERNGD